MSVICNLFKPYNPMAIAKAMLVYQRNQHSFDNIINRDKLDTLTRYTLNTLDEKDVIQKAISDFNKAFDTAIQALTSKGKIKLETANNIKSKVLETLHVELDEHQEDNSSNDTEDSIKDKNELLDTNQSNLEAHIAELYGVDSYSIVNSMKSKFSDAIINSAFFNIVNKAPVPRSNVVLNKNIQELKGNLFANIVQFLSTINPDVNGLTMYDESGNLIGSSYYKILGEFYKYIKGIDNLSDKLYNLYSKESDRGIKDNNTNTYKLIVAKLLENPEFSSRFERKYTNNFNRNLAKTTLYEANNLSSYFFTILDIAKKANISEVNINGKTIDLQKLPFNQEDSNLLTALNSYTQLTHFDELLKDQFGLDIDIKSGQFGLEFGESDKYEFHQDNAHQKKSWQSSESIESEKYIAKLVDRLLDQVKIYGFKTQEYQNKSATPTSAINAARNFIDDLIFRHINFTDWKGGSKKREIAIKDIVNHAVNLHDNPEYHFQQMLEILFDSDLASNLSITRNMAMNQFDLDTLYSLYRTALDRTNPNSLISQENIEATEGPVSLMSREIAALVDRNTPAYYTEVSFDENTGAPVVKVKKRFFNSLQTYKQRTQINNKVNNRTLDQARALNDKYDFQVTPIINKISYVAYLDDNLKLEYRSENILKTTEKGSFQDKELFKQLQNINILDFRQRILKNEALSKPEQDLKSLISFIDTQLGINILTSVGLQQLNIFQMLKPSNIQDLTRLAMKAAFVNYLYAQAGEDTLKNYLSDNKFGIINILRENPNSKLFSTKFDNLKINIASYNDEVIQYWADAYSILTGQASKATIKNKEGNATPNNTISKLGTDAIYYFNKQKNTNVSSLYFVQNNTKIVKIHHDLEVTSQWVNDKQVKNFSQRELFFHSIFNKFYGSYISNNKTLIIQPTVYSDKTTFLNYEINSNLFGDLDILEDEDYQNTIVKQYINTIGITYKNIYNTSKTNLNKLLEAYNNIHSIQYNTIEDLLWNLSENELVQLASNNNIDITMDADYRVIKDQNGRTHLTTNELLEYYANTLYNNEEELKKFLQIQKNLFAQQLLDTGNIFQVLGVNDTISNYVSDRLPEDIKSKNPIIQTIIKVLPKDERISFFKNWVDESTGRLILCKVNGNNYINSGTILGDVELNPLLDRFFYIEGFLSNNLRMSLTGSEINHPNKAYNTLYDQVVKTTNKEDYEKLGLKANNFDKVKQILSTIKSIDDLRTIKVSASIQKDISKIYLETITKIANVAQGTQFKRNVIIPATLQYCEQNTINGISSKVKCAVIYDEKAPVFNYRGTHEKNIDSADGSAKINPFQSILENKALGTQAVGFTKKPIWHAYDSTTGTAFLAKFATNTITNEAMRDSMLAHTSLYKLFKKMTNLQWQDDIDLTQSITKKNPLGNRSDNSLLTTWFQNKILGNVAGDNTNKLLYKDKYGNIQQIHGLDYSIINGRKIYYTLEQHYIKGVSVINPKPKYHLYLDQHYIFNSKEEVQKFLETNPEAHTINSLFELHDALGGVYCVNSEGEYSEFNNEVVVNYMNNVGAIKADAESKILNQENYSQPLKKYHIGYALNNTAVKNGAKNINKSSAWYDDNELHYFEVDSAGLGMQMNADHDIINSELTEFSQVITATAAYGYTYDNTNEIFQGLAKASLSTTQQLRNSVNKFLDQNFENPEQAKSDLYDSIGRIIMVSSSIKDKESLQGIIMEAVNQIFYKSKNHNNDNTKIPFSDPNIYSDFIATLTSTINKEAIKRKHPGSGCVMVPAYNMIQYYEFGGNKYMFNDVLVKARAEYKNNLISLLTTHPNYDAKTNKIDDLFIRMASIQDLENKIKELNIENPYTIDTKDTSQFCNTLVTNYLNRLQQNPELIKPKSWFMPTDIVNIVNENGETHTFALDSMDDYYKFKLGLNDIEVAKNVKINVDFPKNKYIITDNNGNSTTLFLNENGQWEVTDNALSEIAALIKGTIILPNGTEVNSSPLNAKLTYIENITKPRNLRPSTIRWQDAETGDWFNIFDSNVIKNSYLTGTQNIAGVQEELNNIQQGVYTKSDGSQGTIKEGTLDNQAAELIMSNIYKDKFGIDDESLSQILEQGEDYFKRKFNKINTPANTNYDLAFIKDTGACTLLKFGNLTINEFLQHNDFNLEQLYTNENDEVYLMKNNQQQFKIGKWINISDATYKDGNFYIKGEVQDKSKYRLKDPSDPTSIQKLITYVSRYSYSNKKINKAKKVLYKIDTMYQIAPIEDFIEALGNVQDAVKQRAKIVSDIYTADKYKLAQINSLITNAKQLGTIVSGTTFIQSNNFISQDVKDLLKAQIEDINVVDYMGKNISEEDKKKLKDARKENWKNYQQRLTEFLNKETHKRYISFLDSLNYIASRIPAQSLQSFMTMKAVAWTGNSKNMAYVSHFQTYLQGSDYSIKYRYFIDMTLYLNKI